MARKSRTSRSATAEDVADIEALLREIEGRLDYLSSAAAVDGRRLGGMFPDIIAAAIAGLTGLVGQKARDGAVETGAGAGRASAGGWGRLENNVDPRPVLAIALAASVGFVVGLLARRQAR